MTKQRLAGPNVLDVCRRSMAAITESVTELIRAGLRAPGRTWYISNRPWTAHGRGGRAPDPPGWRFGLPRVGSSRWIIHWSDDALPWVGCARARAETSLCAAQIHLHCGAQATAFMTERRQCYWRRRRRRSASLHRKSSTAKSHCCRPEMHYSSSKHVDATRYAASTVVVVRRASSKWRVISARMRLPDNYRPLSRTWGTDNSYIIITICTHISRHES